MVEHLQRISIRFQKLKEGFLSRLLLARLAEVDQQVNVTRHFALRNQKVETVMQVLGLDSRLKECEHNFDVICLVASTK